MDVPRMRAEYQRLYYEANAERLKEAARERYAKNLRKQRQRNRDAYLRRKALKEAKD